jgi:tape measure domain-containing protein
MATGGNALLRLRLTGQQQVVAGLKQSSAAVGQFSGEVSRANMRLQETHKRTWLMNQALFTLRRFAYAGTIAMAGLTAAAYHMGFQFNITMENNRLAFTRFLGSQQAATTELNTLYELARKSPFEFAPLTNTVRQFLAFGFTLEDTNRNLRAMADAVAGFGLGQEAIERATLALGQMRSTGRLLGQDVRQLMQLGLFNPEDFARRVGIAQSQVFNIGDLNIPAKTGIDAIVAYWEEKFGGASADFAKTFQGQVSTLRDDISKLFGALTLRAFDRLRLEVFPAMDKMINEMQLAASSGKSFTDVIAIMDRHLGARGGLLWSFIILRNLLQTAGNIWTQMINPALRQAALLIVPLVISLRFFTDGLRILTGQSHILSYVLGLVIAAFIYYKIAMMAAWVWNIRLALAMDYASISAGRQKGFIALLARGMIFLSRTMWSLAVRSYRVLLSAIITTSAWIARETAILVFQARVLLRSIVTWAAYGAMLAYVRLATLAMTVATWLLNIALDANPIVLIAQGVALLVVGLVYLEMRFHLVRKAAVWLWDRMKAFYAWMMDTGRKISHSWWGKAIGMALKTTPVVGPVVQGAGLGLKALQHGGAVTAAGAFLVGERGPEIAMLPRGAAVSPIGTGLGDFAFPGISIEPAPIYLDKKKVAEAVFSVRLDRAARK